MPSATTYSLANNSRFYILLSTILLSIFIAAALRMTVLSDQLFVIRLQQTFGLLCILYWYLALIISPLGYVIGKHRLKRLEFARRAIGVSAAYFAILHALIALFGQLGGLSGVATLSPLFQWSLAAGLFGVVVLTLMAATSFDKVIEVMTFRRWKWLHRFTYAGGVLAVLHVWSVGSHAGYGVTQILALVGLGLLAGLEMFRITTLMSKKSNTTWSTERFNGTFLLLWAVIVFLIAIIPKYVDSYRGNEINGLHGIHSNSHEGDDH